MPNLVIGENMDSTMSEKVRGKGTEFERIRRITGYLVGTLNRFNNGKRAEVEDRVKHGTSTVDSIESVIEVEKTVVA